MPRKPVKCKGPCKAMVDPRQLRRVGLCTACHAADLEARRAITEALRDSPPRPYTPRVVSVLTGGW